MDYEQEINQKIELEEAKEKKSDEESLFFLALHNVLNTKDGRFVFKHLLALQPIDERFFTSDVVKNAFIEGRRDLICEIRQILKINFVNDILGDIEKETL